MTEARGETGLIGAEMETERGAKASTRPSPFDLDAAAAASQALRLSSLRFGADAWAVRGVRPEGDASVDSSRREREREGGGMSAAAGRPGGQGGLAALGGADGEVVAPGEGAAVHDLRPRDDCARSIHKLRIWISEGLTQAGS